MKFSGMGAAFLRRGVREAIAGPENTSARWDPTKIPPG
jgi:hypothetical protein